MGDNRIRRQNYSVQTVLTTSSEDLECQKSSHRNDDYNKYLIHKDVMEDFSFAQPIIASPCQPTGEDQLSRLSDEVLLSILRLVKPPSSLAAVACTCRRLARLSKDESLWQRLDLAFAQLPPASLFHILSRGVRALRLNTTMISLPAFIDEQILLCRVGKIWKVEYLDLSNAHILAKDLAILLGGCKCVIKLSLESCDVTNCGKAIASMARLNTLNLACATGLTKEDVYLIARNCTKLVELNVSWTNLSRDSVSELCKNISPHLTALNIAGAVKSLTNSDVTELTQRCKKLVMLDISDCWKINGESLLSIVTNLSNTLESISFSRSYNIRLTDIVELSVCKKLRRVNMFGSPLGKEQLRSAIAALPSGVVLNQDMMSDVARPTVGVRRTSIWGVACRSN